MKFLCQNHTAPADAVSVDENTKTLKIQDFYPAAFGFLWGRLAACGRLVIGL